MNTFSRTENTARNLVWGLSRRSVSLLGPFVVRALLVYQLGAEYLGLASLYTSILQVLNLAELGFASAVSFGMYKPIAEGDDDAVACYLGYFRTVYRCVGLGIVVLGLLALPVLPHLIKADVPGDVQLQLAFLLYLLNAALSYFLFAYKQSLLSAYQRNDLVDKVGLAAMLAQFLLQAVFLLAAPNFYTYALAMPLCTVLGNLAIAAVSSRCLPQFSACALRGRRLPAGQRLVMRKRLVGLGLQKACMVVRDAFPNVVVSAFVGLSAVALYSNYFVVASGLLGVLGTVGTAMTAAVGNSIVAEDVEKNAADLRLFVFAYALVSIVCAACLLVLYQPFVSLWVGEDLLLPFGFALLMVVYFYVRTLGDIRTVYVNATGVWWDLRWRALAETLAYIVLDLALGWLWGIYGVLVASLIVLFFFNFLYGSHLVFKLYFGLKKARSYYLDHARYLLAAAVVCAVVYALCRPLPDHIWLLLLAKGLLAALCSSGLLFALFGRSDLFDQVRLLAKRVFRVQGKGNGGRAG